MKSAIVDYLNSNNEEGIPSKKLRKMVIAKVSECEDEQSKEMKKLYGTALLSLVEKGKVSLEEDGKLIKLTVTEVKISKDKDKKKNDKSKDTNDNKRKRNNDNDGNDGNDDNNNDNDNRSKYKSSTDGSHKKSNSQTSASTEKYFELWKNGEQIWRDNGFDHDYLTNNPDGYTRLFCGNLNKKVTEEELKNFIEGITYIKWITDKQSGEFYGSTFIEMRDPKIAIAAVAKDKQKFMGRPLKIYFCPPKPGDIWPPRGGGSSSNGRNDPPRRERTIKPTGCTKLYMGNLSYNIDDETICDFFKECGTIVGLRWLTRQGTEEFRGGGFVQFSNTDEVDKAIKLDGVELLGRPIKLDYTE